MHNVLLCTRARARVCVCVCVIAVLPLCSVLQIVSLDLHAFSLECVGRGDIFDRTRHASGTEIKAITYSAMDIRYDSTKSAAIKRGNDDDGKDKEKTQQLESDVTAERVDSDSQGAHVFVIVDI